MDHSYACIYHLIVEDFVGEIHHGPSLTRFFLIWCFTGVIHFIPGTFHFLTEPGIFLLWKIGLKEPESNKASTRVIRKKSYELVQFLRSSKVHTCEYGHGRDTSKVRVDNKTIHVF